MKTLIGVNPFYNLNIINNERTTACLRVGEFAEEINAFLEKHHISKVKLIEAGFNALMDEVAESDLGLAKIMDGYDDFFETEKK